ncbi:MAG: AMP-binding protein [Candidatus Obscuribacterales bacterium]|nr:AMP-binding protein [Candidatus Obscuribacterales bacterium]
MDKIVFPDVSQVTVSGRKLPPLPATWPNLVQAVLVTARFTPDKIFATNSDGATCTFRQAVEKSVALAQVIHRYFGTGVNVGILLPPGIEAAVTNLAAMMSGNATVNLNAISDEIANMVIADAGIDGIITAQAVVERMSERRLDSGYVPLEMLGAMIMPGDRKRALHFATAINLKRAVCVVPHVSINRNSIAAIMYTSGSTGVPKGAVLTHGNILSNIWQIKHHLALSDSDKLLGVLPFFHSFGFTVTLWTVLVLGLEVVYHPSAVDSRALARLVEEHKLTIVISTPSLLRLALPRLTREGFSSVRLLLLGSEKLKPELAATIEDQLNVTAYEGYGCTELSPVAAANVPQSALAGSDNKVVAPGEGSVGLALPGTDIAILDRDTGALLSANQEGLIFLRGPQVMREYYGKTLETAAVLQNGWYYTGDIGRVDVKGRLYLSDRADNVIKMAGEWVPLARIDAAIRQIAGITELEVSTVGVPDQVKGTRPVVLYTRVGLDIGALTKALGASALPALWVPKSRDFFQVDKLPVGATGKLDLKAMKSLALQLTTQADLPSA